MAMSFLPTDCDLSETSFFEATTLLAVHNPANVRLYVSRYNAAPARRLQAEIGFELVVLPPELLPSRYFWVVETPAGMLLGSRGVP